MIKRDSYLNRMIHYMWNGEVKVITGIRRCGKSVLLFDLFYEYLLSQEIQEDHIIKIELDQRRYYRFRNPIRLCEYIESIVTKQQREKFYLFIDEVQLTTKVIDKENGGIEVSIYDMLNELKSYKNLDVYVTGSNSKGLSKDIATEFRGRATQIHVFSLSFEEFYSHIGGDEQKALDTYMLYGGMPRLLAMDDEKDKKGVSQRVGQSASRYDCTTTKQSCSPYNRAESACRPVSEPSVHCKRNPADSDSDGSCSNR